MPERPYFLAFSNGQLSIVIPRSNDNGGSPITSYELWVDQGNDFNSTFRQLTRYQNNSLIFNVNASDGLILGYTYRFISRSQNQIGYSAFSLYSYIAFGDVPTPPGQVIRVNSTETQITVRWSASVSSDLNIKGYILNMDDGTNSDLLPVFISNKPNVFTYTIGNLTVGLPYRFTVQAVNINGNSQASPITKYWACRAPVGLQTPYYISSSSTQITIGWSMPQYNGGCAILGY